MYRGCLVRMENHQDNGIETSKKKVVNDSLKVLQEMSETNFIQTKKLLPVELHAKLDAAAKYYDPAPEPGKRNDGSSLDPEEQRIYQEIKDIRARCHQRMKIREEYVQMVRTICCPH